MSQSEGHACHARGITMDGPTEPAGPDKRVPPKGGVGGASLSCPIEGTCLSRPVNRNGLSNEKQRT